MSKDYDLSGVKSVRQALDRMGLAAEHEKACIEIPAYAHKMEEYVARDLPRDQPKRESVDQQVKRANKRARQLEMEFSDERIKTESLDHLIEGLERIFPGFFFEHNGRDISIRGALESPELWDKAIEKMLEIAAMLRREADLRNRGVKIAHEVRERMEEPWRN